jgi:hypothetical protein
VVPALEVPQGVAVAITASRIAAIRTGIAEAFKAARDVVEKGKSAGPKPCALTF